MCLNHAVSIKDLAYVSPPWPLWAERCQAGVSSEMRLKIEWTECEVIGVVSVAPLDRKINTDVPQRHII